jgi:hypothetical protein
MEAATDFYKLQSEHDLRRTRYVVYKSILKITYYVHHVKERTLERR